MRVWIGEEKEGRYECNTHMWNSKKKKKFKLKTKMKENFVL